MQECSAVHRTLGVHAHSPASRRFLYGVRERCKGLAFGIKGITELVRYPSPTEVDRELVHRDVLVRVSPIVDLVHLEELPRPDRHAPADLLLEVRIAGGSDARPLF